MAGRRAHYTLPPESQALAEHYAGDYTCGECGTHARVHQQSGSVVVEHKTWCQVGIRLKKIKTSRKAS